MKHILLCCFAAAFSLAMSGCTKSHTSVDYDRTANFSSLKTYTWDSIKEAGTQNRSVDGKTVAQILTESVDRELAEKGYVKTTEGKPSFRVHAYTQIQFKRADVAETDPGAIAESRAQAAEDPIPPSPSGGGNTPMQYTEGTIVLDIIDPAIGKTIWRSAAVGVMREKVDPAERAVRLDAEVRKMLAGFPPR